MAKPTITELEMTSPSRLVPGRSPPRALELEEVDGSAAPLLRTTYIHLGAPHGWVGRTAWTDAQWVDELSRPGIRAWIARVDGEVAGLVELEAGAGGEAGIVVFGLVPELVGQGFGGAFLTRATELAWSLTAPDGAPTRRVRVQTWSTDHPHALSNYVRRGFRARRPSAGPRSADPNEPLPAPN